MCQEKRELPHNTFSWFVACKLYWPDFHSFHKQTHTSYPTSACTSCDYEILIYISLDHTKNLNWKWAKMSRIECFRGLLEVCLDGFENAAVLKAWGLQWPRHRPWPQASMLVWAPYTMFDRRLDRCYRVCVFVHACVLSWVISGWFCMCVCLWLYVTETERVYRIWKGRGFFKMSYLYHSDIPTVQKG